MRVCVLVHRFPVRSETFIVSHVAGLIKRGHHVLVVPFTARGTSDWSPPGDVVETVRTSSPVRPAPPARGASRYARFGALAVSAAVVHRARPWRFAFDSAVTAPTGVGRKLLVAERVAASGPFDIVHAQFGTTASAAVALRRHGITDARIVCSIHGQDANVNLRQHAARFAALAQELDAVTVGTEFMRQVVAELGVPVEKLRLWPQGVDVDTIQPTGRTERADEFRVLSVGRLVEFKGVDDSLRVIAAARGRIRGLRYTVIGEGPLRADLEQLALELGVHDITTFVGAKDHAEVIAAHRVTDVFLQMGKVGSDGSREGQGVGPAEASASGLPVVATRSGGLAEVVLDGVTGLVYEIGDVQSAADGLVRLAQDAELRSRLGDGGIRRVRELFSLAGTISTIETIYSEALR